MDSVEARVAFPILCDLGEGSLWDEERGVLFWVDISQNKVFRFDPSNSSNLAYDVGESVGTVVLTQNDRLLLALRSGFAWLDPETGKVTKISDPEADLPDNRFNDGKCDPQGRFWAGTMVEHGPREKAALYCLDTDLTVSRKVEGVTVSNGLVWSGDRRLFYYIDTPTQQVALFDFDPESGNIENRRVAAEVPKPAGSPDGMAIDEEGHLWIALFGGYKVIRVDPTSGEIEFEVTLPVRNVTSCAFGGTDLRQLFVTTARVGLDADQRKAQPLAGSLFTAEVPFRGTTTARFARDV